MATPAKRAAPPIPPDKGSFPLDHFGQCTQPKAAYLQCIKRQQAAALEPSGKPKTVDTAVCKPLIKLYLQCRMDKSVSLLLLSHSYLVIC